MFGGYLLKSAILLINIELYAKNGVLELVYKLLDDEP